MHAKIGQHPQLGIAKERHMIDLDIMINFTINIIHEMGIGIVFLIVGLSFQRIRRRLYRRKFKYAFGFVVENGDRFAISIPLWTLKENRR